MTRDELVKRLEVIDDMGSEDRRKWFADVLLELVNGKPADEFAAYGMPQRIAKTRGDEIAQIIVDHTLSAFKIGFNFDQQTGTVPLFWIVLDDVHAKKHPAPDVAEKIRDSIGKAINAEITREREACAVLMESMTLPSGSLAEMIRARSNEGD